MPSTVTWPLAVTAASVTRGSTVALIVSPEVRRTVAVLVPWPRDAGRGDGGGNVGVVCEAEFPVWGAGGQVPTDGDGDGVVDEIVVDVPAGDHVGVRDGWRGCGRARQRGR